MAEVIINLLTAVLGVFGRKTESGAARMTEGGDIRTTEETA